MSSLVGRHRILTELAEFRDRAWTAGRAASIDLVGPPGIGKSSVLATLLTMPAPDEGTMLYAAVESSDRMRPLALLDRLVPLDRDDSGAPAGGDIGLLARAERLTRALEQQSDTPLFIVVDDVQWIDPASAVALGEALTALRDRPVVALLARRPTPSEHHVVDLLEVLAGDSHRLIELDPLGDDAVRALAADAIGGRPGRTLLSHLAGAAGNPLLIQEVIAGLAAEQRLDTDDGVTEVRGATPPTSFTESVGRRIAALGDEVAETLRAASVLGRRFAVRDVAELTGRPPSSLARPLGLAFDAGLLLDDGAVAGFRHDLVRDAVYVAMPSSVRAALHQHAAQILGDRKATALEVGAHLVLGAQPGDDRAIAWLRDAAAEAAVATPEVALEFLDRALDLAGPQVGAQRLVQRGRLDALTALGRIEDAQSVAEWLLPTTPPHELPELQARYAGLLTLRGSGADAVLVLDRALADAEDETEQSRLLAIEALTRLTTSDFRGAHEAGERAVELGARADDPVGWSAGLAIAARIETFDHRYAEAIRRGGEAVAIADTDPSGLAHRHAPLLYYGMSALDGGRPELAMRAIARSRELATRHGMDWSLPVLHGLSAATHYRNGAIDDAAVEAEIGVELADRTDSMQARLWCESILVLAALDRGDLDRAGHWIERASATFSAGRSPLGTDHAVLAQARFEHATGAGDPDRTLCDAWDLFEHFGTHSCHPLIAPELVRATMRAGDLDRARSTTAAIRGAAASDVPDLAALADRLEGLVAGDAGRLSIAATELRRLGRQLDAADCRHDLALIHAQGGKPAEASDEGRAAVADFTRCGAEGRARRVQKELGDCGVDLASPNDKEPTSSAGWAALTPTERATVELLVTGLTNREIADRRGVSRRTVETQLQRAYAKTGITSRVAMAVAAADALGLTQAAPTDD